MADARKNTEDREIRITRVVDAPAEMVFDAMMDPKQVVQWWGPTGFTTTIHEMDVRPGGVWSHTMHGPDGRDYPNYSVFVEIVRPKRVVFDHGGGKGGPTFRASWTFDAQGSKTKLTLLMIFPTAKQRDGVVKKFNAIEGGNQTLGRLEEFLAKRS